MDIHSTISILVFCLSSLSLAEKRFLFDPMEVFVKAQTVFETWGSWSSCTGYICGLPGSQHRTRGCHHWVMGFMHFSTECPMYGKETQYCTVNCSESTTTTSSAGDWGPWGAFSACDKTCGGGVHMRYRACRIGSCVGDSLQSSSCNAQHCPVHHTAHRSTKAPTSPSPLSSTTASLSTKTSTATQMGIVSSTSAPSIGTTTVFPNTTISSTSGLNERTCKVCGDYENGIPCDIRSIYIGPEVKCGTGKDFCMTDIISDGSGKEQVFKRCVNEAVCRTQWLSQTSDQDYCVQYGKVVVNGVFSCHFCCTSDECNQGLVPDSSTFYTRS